jgi:DNA-binding winged helix-turn-helix (wHTH) protein/tetratricopeptide (TPR) repeat protein
MPLPGPLGGSYVFDRFQLSADGTLLVRDGAVVTLAPKVLQTLLVLVQHPGEVVRKEDLLQAVWPDSFVEDTGLTRNISLLRRSLGEDGQRLVVTVARVGYRLTASVEHVEAAASSGIRAFGHGNRAHAERGRPVVGREKELNRLRAEFEGADGGRGGILAITGEPGIGKTTVVEAFLQAVPRPCSIGRGRCSERLAGAEPHLPVLEALVEVTAHNPMVAGALRRVAPTWFQYVSPTSVDRIGASQPSRTGSPERLVRELTTFLEEATRAQPMVIFIEDLHWADVSTVDLLAHLAARLPRMRLLVLVTYRQRDMLVSGHPFARLRGELMARGHLDELAVSLLGLDHVREYLKLAFGDAPVPTDVAALVFQRTEGNPLFMVEIVRYLRQRGIPSEVPAMSRDVPDSLRGLIDRMLKSLDPATRQLLSIAAVQGYEFDSATVAGVAGSATSEAEERLQSVDQIHALVRFDREDESADGALSLVYRFTHVLYQDALIGTLAPSRRIEWARQIAEALILSHAGRTDSIAGSLALLFDAGREFWKASEFFLTTSRHAARLFAFLPASELASRGLQCLRSARAVDRSEASRRELDLTFARLVPLASIQGYASEEVETLTQRVVELSQELGDLSATAAALGATWIVRMVRGECTAARDAGTRLALLAEAADNAILLINAHMNAQIACHHLGDFRQARVHAVAVMALSDRAPRADRCIGVLDPVVASLAESARNNWIIGYLSRAFSDAEAAVALGRELRHPDSLAFAWLFHGWMHGYAGDWQTCLASTETGLGIARDSGSVQTLAWNQCIHGWALAHVGDVETGRSEFSAAIDASKAIMGQVALPQFIAMMAEVLLLSDDLAGAETWLRQATEFERSHDDRYFSAQVRRLSAVCLARRGQLVEALAGLRDAIDVARSQGAVTFELRAALSLAAQDPEEGRLALRSVLARFPEPEPWPELRAAQRILQ